MGVGMGKSAQNDWHSQRNMSYSTQCEENADVRCSIVIVYNSCQCSSCSELSITSMLRHACWRVVLVRKGRMSDIDIFTDVVSHVIVLFSVLVHCIHPYPWIMQPSWRKEEASDDPMSYIGYQQIDKKNRIDELQASWSAISRSNCSTRKVKTKLTPKGRETNSRCFQIQRTPVSVVCVTLKVLLYPFVCSVFSRTPWAGVLLVSLALLWEYPQRPQIRG